MIEYVAAGNPNGVRKLAYEYGYPNFKTYEGSLRFLHHFLKKEGERGLDDLIMQHPDKEIILEIYSLKNPQKVPINISGNGNSIENIISKSNDNHKAMEGETEVLTHLLAKLITQRKEKLAFLLKKYGEKVKDPKDLKELTNKVTEKIYEGDEGFLEDLGKEINEILSEEESLFITDIISKVGKGVKGLIGGITGKNAQGSSSPNDVAMAAINYKMNLEAQKQKERDAKMKQHNLIIMAGIAGSAVVLILIIFMLTHKP